MSEEESRPWWQDGVVYQIYPRSFADSNGDGVGDLRGIIAHLDYLNDGTERSLGVDAIWLSPINPSPMFDFGYDVSDYRGIAAEFGTLDDFDELVREAHARGIRIVLDLVPNHTSHLHPWFVESRASRESAKRDWYVWHDGKDGGPPNEWMATFGGRAWEWDEATRQWYLHSFLAEQPDLNWRNPAVQREMWDTLRWWLARGVDGFRLDVINWLVKDDQLRDNPTRRLGRRAYDRQTHVYDRNRPETIDLVKQLRGVVDEFPERMTVGEVYAAPPGDPALAASYYAGGEGLHLVFNFSFLYCPWKANAFGEAIETWERILPANCWPTYTLGNHDQPRLLSRYAARGTEQARARVAAALVLTQRGTPFLYYGDEIGMRNGKIRKSEIRDPLGLRYWPLPFGRDPERTPMQWSAARGAGFTGGEPWLPINPDHTSINVAAQIDDPDSLLSWYRRLTRLRRDEVALRRGSFRRLDQGSEVLGYLREHEGDRIAVLLGFARRARPASLPAGSSWRVLLGTHRATGDTLAGGALGLGPSEVLIAKAATPHSRTLGVARRGLRAVAR